MFLDWPTSRKLWQVRGLASFDCFRGAESSRYYLQRCDVGFSAQSVSFPRLPCLEERHPNARDIVLQGYMYLTNAHLCFFAHMPSREVSFARISLKHCASCYFSVLGSNSKVRYSQQESAADETLEQALVRIAQRRAVMVPVIIGSLFSTSFRRGCTQADGYVEIGSIFPPRQRRPTIRDIMRSIGRQSFQTSN
jgi:hypothetical protein